MTFPTIAASNSSVQATNSTSHTMSLPASISAGDLLLACVIADARPGNELGGTLAADWTFLLGDSPGSDLVRIYVYYRRATGSEGSTVAFTTSTSQCTAHRAYRITGIHESTNPVAGSNAAETTTLNPLALNPSAWDVEDTLWILFIGNDDGTTTVTTFPTNYINTGQLAGGDATDGVNIAWGTRENAIASEDPSTITFSASESTVCSLVAIRPTAVLPPITPTVITHEASVYQPFIQNMTLQPATISAAAEFVGHEPSVMPVVSPASISATATLHQPTVANLGTQQNIDPAFINVIVTMNPLIGVFLVGPISPPALSVPATFFQPFVGANIVPSTITVATTVYSPTMNLAIQYLNLDRIVVGMFVFSPDVQGASGMAGLRATVRDLPKTSTVGEPDFKASVTTLAKTDTFNEVNTATLREA